LTQEHITLNALLKKVRPHGVRLDLPSFLEGDSLEVNFRFSSTKELRERIDSLVGLVDREEIRRMLELLKP